MARLLHGTEPRELAGWRLWTAYSVFDISFLSSPRWIETYHVIEMVALEFGLKRSGPKSIIKDYCCLFVQIEIIITEGSGDLPDATITIRVEIEPKFLGWPWKTDACNIQSTKRNQGNHNCNKPNETKRIRLIKVKSHCGF